MRILSVSCLLAALACSGQAAAAVYKCMVDGKPVFSGTPCATDAQEVNLHYHKADPQEAARVRKQLDDFQKEVAEDKRQRKIRQLRRKIGRLERARDAALERLRAKKLYARNNLAGATWEQSVSEEMSAVTAQYGQKIEAVRAELDRLRKP